MKHEIVTRKMFYNVQSPEKNRPKSTVSESAETQIIGKTEYCFPRYVIILLIGPISEVAKNSSF
jgi:hypothetical protein